MSVFFRRAIFLPFWAALLLSLPAGCASGAPVKTDFFAMDTYCSVLAYGKHAAEAVSGAEAEMNRLDAMFSRQNEESDVSALNARSGGAAYAVPEELFNVISLARSLSARTGGAFDSTVAPLMDLWDFKNESPRVPAREEIETLLPLVGWNQVELDDGAKTVLLPLAGMRLDLGGIAKGYASVRLAALMRESGVNSALISLGGNIAAVGKKPDGSPWKVGVQDPRNTDGLVGVVSAEDCYLITSGDYERYFLLEGQRYHHILDPKTGYPAANGLISATVINQDGTAGDALSTALVVFGTERAIDFWRASNDFEAILVTDDRRVLVTQGLADRFSFRGEEAGYALSVIPREP